jgi:hypothetical protein
VWIGHVIQRRRDGSSWKEILWFAFAKPAWWVGWYPRRLRHAGDVWPRLPPDLRRARATVWIFVVLWISLTPTQLIIMSSDDIYRKTGQKAPIQQFTARLPRELVVTTGRLAAISTLGLMASVILFSLRWGRLVRRTRSNVGVTNAMFFRDTGHRSFWLKPEVAAFLLREGPDPARAPGSPRELASAISAAVERLPGGSQALGAGARDGAASLASAIAGLDAEIASLSSNADTAERERLETKLAALGPAPPNEDEARRQMRELLQRQLDLLRGFESRLEALRAVRTKRFELLRALWRQAIDLREAANDPGREAHATGRIRALCAEIAQHLDGAGTNPTVAITEAPTMERS